MEEQTTTQDVMNAQAENRQRKDNIYRSYNYVGTKVTIAYLFND